MIYQKHRLTPSTISGRTVQFIAISQYQLIVKEIQLQSRVHERRIKSKSIFMLRILGKKRETETETGTETERVKHELRGIEQVRTIISQLVSAVTFFKGIF